jgi:hypothetical protein
MTYNIFSVAGAVFPMISPATYFALYAAVVGTVVVPAGAWSEHPAIITPKIRIRLIGIP